MADLSRTEPTGAVEGRSARQLAERVRAVAAPIVRALDLELVEVQCAGHGARTVVRVFIDKPGGVGIGDCEQVHLSLGHALDVEDPIPHGYTLEVSSPGLDRPLRRREDFLRSAGKLISVKLRRPYLGQWRLVGRLIETKESGLTVALTGPDSGTTADVEWETIADARLEVEFTQRREQTT
jgi:ribosome maturation factor RimP